MSNTIEHAKDQRWVIFTMTRDDELYGDDGKPLDDDYGEWSIGWDVVWRGDPERHYANAGCIVAENLSWSMANYLVDLHNAQLAATDQAVPA